MSEAQKLAVNNLLQGLAQVWQFGAALVLIGVAWGTLRAEMTLLERMRAAGDAEVRQQLMAVSELGSQRREASDRVRDERDARTEGRLQALETRAGQTEQAVAAMRQDVLHVRAGVDELLREARQRR